MSRREPRGAVAGQWLLALVLLAVASALAIWQPPSAPLMAPSAQAWGIAALVLGTYAAGCAALWWLRRRRLAPDVPVDDDALAVVHASQTGRAEQLAQWTALALREAGIDSRCVPLAELDAAALSRRTRLLFIVSTTGEGDAPESAYRFVRDQLQTRPALPQLRYGLLALGDRRYRNFCAFGHALDRWLRHAGAQSLFDAIEVDGNDDGALRHWQQQLRTLAGEHAEIADWQVPRYEAATLRARECLNPSSVGAPVYRITLQPEHALHWRAGDVVEIGPGNADPALQDFAAALGLDLQQGLAAGTLAEALRRRQLPAGHDARKRLRGLDVETLLARLPEIAHREYSIASLPQDGALELLVRLTRYGDGGFGVGSVWLCAHAAIGAPIALRVRSNQSFHLDAASDAPLLMIANGTGIAGLRAHWRARIAAGRHRNWLIFGERLAAHDFHFGEELAAAQAAGRFARIDTAFSREPGSPRYVQDLLRREAAAIRAWIDAGATVLVCGSLATMAPAVDAALREVLGELRYEQLLDAGRYRRDVY